MSSKINKNYSLNVIKGIACFCVVHLHAPFPGVTGKVLYGFARFAVPFFFMISGYFVYDKNFEQIKRKLPGKIKHIWRFFLFAEILYFIWHISEKYLNGGCRAILEWLKGTFTVLNCIILLLFQTTMVGDVSWFLLALILCYLSVYIVGSQNLWKHMAGVSILLLVCNVLIAELLPILGFKIQWFYNSNFLLLGCPFFYIGALIKQSPPKANDAKLLTVLFAGSVLVLIERILTSASQFFWGNLFMAYSIFMYAVRYPRRLNNKWIENIGEKYSFGVYILHPIVRDICKYFFPQTIIYLWVRPIVIFCGSLLIIEVYMKIKGILTKIRGSI